MTKTEQIRRLLDRGWTMVQIAAHVGCRREYVSVVKERRKGKRPCDRAWETSAAYRAYRSQRHAQKYATDPDYRADRIARSAAWRRARKASQEART